VLVALQSARAELLCGDVACTSAGTHANAQRTFLSTQTYTQNFVVVAHNERALLHYIASIRYVSRYARLLVADSSVYTCT
jgi:hypothetical protein